MRRFRKIGQRLVARLSQPVIILLYHRVALLDIDPLMLSVTPQHFAEHLEVIRQSYQPLPLQALANCTHMPRFGTKPGIVVTFDDGYADNLYQAAPLLEDRHLPATVFITSGSLGQEFWWDRLEHLLHPSNMLPSSLQLEVDGCPYTWESLGTSPEAHQELFYEIFYILRPLPHTERQRALSELALWAGISPAIRDSHRALTSEEVRQLGASESVEIGAHTITHPVLATLPSDIQSMELSQSRLHLEQVSGRSVHSLAYPFGTRVDTNQTTIELAQEAGFLLACANVKGSVRPGTNPYFLPRYVVRDWDGEQFARQLRVWTRT
jgi:peptidoglycan/xylan/chitin deacetylase (PgdA/CDA1 family)